MKKVKQIGIIIIIFIIAFVAIYFKNKDKKTEQVSIQEEKQEKLPVEWHGNYIWNNTNDNNTWMCHDCYYERGGN